MVNSFVDINDHSIEDSEEESLDNYEESMVSRPDEVV